MDWQSKDEAAKPGDAALTLFVRPVPRELESGEIDRVAGGSGPIMCPNG